MKSVHCETQGLILKRYSDREVFELEVEDIFWDSSKDKPLAIPFIGRSGAGKSTLLEALATMLPPNEGSISWRFFDDNHEALFDWSKDKPLSPDEIALFRTRYIGFAFQDTTLTPFLTIEDNLVYPQRLLDQPVSLAKKHARKSLAKVFSNGITKILRKYPHELSGGERQRVSLVQAMCNDPYILFADEPTGSLDEQTREEVLKVVRDWQKRSGGMFLWVTHHESDKHGRQSYLKISKTIDEKPNKAFILVNEG